MCYSRAVHSTRFSLDGLNALSASDDCSVRLWDLSCEIEVFGVKEHKVAHSKIILSAFTSKKVSVISENCLDALVYHSQYLKIVLNKNREFAFGCQNEHEKNIFFQV